VSDHEPTSSRAEATSLRGLGLFSICLGAAGLGIGSMAYGMIFFQRAMFAKIGDLDPNYAETQGDAMVQLFDQLHGLMQIHMPIWAVGGVVLLVLGVLMRRGNRKAAVGVIVVSALALLEIAYYSWASSVLMADMPGFDDAALQEVGFDLEAMMASSAILNFLFMAAPPALLAFLTARELRRGG